MGRSCHLLTRSFLPLDFCHFGSLSRENSQRNAKLGASSAFINLVFLAGIALSMGGELADEELDEACETQPQLSPSAIRSSIRRFNSSCPSREETRTQGDLDGKRGDFYDMMNSGEDVSPITPHPAAIQSSRRATIFPVISFNPAYSEFWDSEVLTLVPPPSPRLRPLSLSRTVDDNVEGGTGAEGTHPSQGVDAIPFRALGRRRILDASPATADEDVLFKDPGATITPGLLKLSSSFTPPPVSPVSEKDSDSFRRPLVPASATRKRRKDSIAEHPPMPKRRPGTSTPGAFSPNLPSSIPLPSRGRSRRRRSSNLSRPSGSQIPHVEPNVDGHGHTTYIPVPEPRLTRSVIYKTAVPHAEHPEITGDWRVVLASENGMYLEDFHKKYSLPTFGRSIRDPNDEDSRSAFSSPNPLQDELNRNLGSDMIRASPTNKWMTETWGPEPIEYYPRVRYQRADSGLHPSSTGVISSQYGGWLAETDGHGRKRPKRVRREFDDEQHREGPPSMRSKFPTPLTQRSTGKTCSLSSSSSSLSSAEADSSEASLLSPSSPLSPPRSPHVTRRVEDPNAFCRMCGTGRHVDGDNLMPCVICEAVPTCSPLCQLQHTAMRHVRDSTHQREPGVSAPVAKPSSETLSCAVCGATEHGDGGPLKPCPAGVKVAYCSTECFDGRFASHGRSEWAKQVGWLGTSKLPPVLVDTLALPGTMAGPEKRCIVRRVRTIQFRHVQYLVILGNESEFKWIDALHLGADDQLVAIQEFWSQAHNRKLLHMMDNPESESRPSGFARHVISGGFHENYRGLFYIVREFSTKPDDDVFHFAPYLGQEWNEPIERFWRKVAAGISTHTAWERVKDHSRRREKWTWTKRDPPEEPREPREPLSRFALCPPRVLSHGEMEQMRLAWDLIPARPPSRNRYRKPDTTIEVTKTYQTRDRGADSPQSRPGPDPASSTPRTDSVASIQDASQ